MREANDRNSHASVRFDALDCALLVALCAMTALILCKDITVGGLHDPDSAAHAMDGVLIHDWIAAGTDAITSPMHFAREQYAHYPTLGIGRHYPPAFAIVESAFFAVLGISPVTARLCVVFFGLIATCGVYRFVRGFADRTVAALSVVLLMTMPATTTWGRQVMLEIPTLAALVWAAVSFQWYLKNLSWRRLVVVLSVSALTMTVKQPSVFLLCAVAGAMVFAWRRGRISGRQTVVALVVAFASLGAILLVLDSASFKVLSGYYTFTDRWSWASLSYYATVLPSQVGVVVLVLALAGVVLSRGLAPDVRNFLLCWFGIVYVMITVSSLKTPRFVYLGLLPVAVFAAFSLGAMLRAVSIMRLRPIAAVVVSLLPCAIAMGRTLEPAPDYGPVVAAHRAQMDGEVVLFSGLRDGDFVFAAREELPWRHTTILRGSKIFYTCVARPSLDLVTYVKSKGELVRRMREFAFRYVFVERENQVGTQPDAWLREYLAEGDDYRRIASYPYPCDVPDSDRGDVTIDVYELAKPYERTVDHFDIPMPRTGKPIRVQFPKRIAMAESGK